MFLIYLLVFLLLRLGYVVHIHTLLMDIFLLGIFHMSLCSYFNRDYAEEGQFMMITGPNSHNPGSLPRISCPRVAVWPWASLSLSMPSVQVFGASWCCLSPIFASALSSSPQLSSLLQICIKSIRTLPEKTVMYFALSEFLKILKQELTVSEWCICALLHLCSLPAPQWRWLGSEIAVDVPLVARGNPGTHLHSGQAHQWAGEGETIVFGRMHHEWTHCIAPLLLSSSLQVDPGSKEE